MILDSVTALPPDARGKAALAASHAGAYCARCVVRAELSGVILHDAGVGRERAGIAGVYLLDEWRIPAAAVSHRSARIGDGADCLRRGVLSFVNEAAARAGLREGQEAAEALEVLRSFAAADSDHPAAERASLAGAKHPAAPAGAAVESRQCVSADGGATEARHLIVRQGDISVVALDSNSLVTASDARSIVLTGSHGGLLGGRADSAIKHRVLAAAYNDADVGIDGAGISRLPALESRGICAFTVSAWSARIGDGMATYEDGFVSHANDSARRKGVTPGISAREAVARLLEHLEDRT